jgi:NADH:ubiquinone oxidoreductase subunit D
MSQIHKAFSQKLDEIDRLKSRVSELEESMKVGRRIISELREFVEANLRRAERVEEHAMAGDNKREQARNNGKATAYEVVLRRISELEGN